MTLFGCAYCTWSADEITCDYLLLVLLAVTVCLCLNFLSVFATGTLLDCGDWLMVGLFGPRAMVGMS